MSTRDNLPTPPPIQYTQDMQHMIAGGQPTTPRTRRTGIINVMFRRSSPPFCHQSPTSPLMMCQRFLSSCPSRCVASLDTFLPRQPRRLLSFGLMTMPSTCVVLYPQQINGRERRSAIISLSPTTHCTPSTTTVQRYNSAHVLMLLGHTSSAEAAAARCHTTITRVTKSCAQVSWSTDTHIICNFAAAVLSLPFVLNF